MYTNGPVSLVIFVLLLTHFLIQQKTSLEFMSHSNGKRFYSFGSQVTKSVHTLSMSCTDPKKQEEIVFLLFFSHS